MKRWSVLALASTLLVAAVIAAPTRAAKQGDEDARVLVKFKKDVKQADRDKARQGQEGQEGRRGVRRRRLGRRVGRRQEGQGPRRRLREGPARSLYAEPDVDLHLFVAPPNDPSFGQQYALQKRQRRRRLVRVSERYPASGGPTIAVIDTGIDRNHPDLASKLDTANSKCFGTLCFLTGYEDDNGHGSHTAGTAAAATNNARRRRGCRRNSRDHGDQGRATPPGRATRPAS